MVQDFGSRIRSAATGTTAVAVLVGVRVTVAVGIRVTVFVDTTTAVFVAVGVEVTEGAAMLVDVAVGVLVNVEGTAVDVAVVVDIGGVPVTVPAGVLVGGVPVTVTVGVSVAGVVVGVTDPDPWRIFTARSVVRLLTGRISAPFAFVEITCVLVVAPAYVSHHSTLKEVLAGSPEMVTVPVIGAMEPVFVQM